MSEHLKVGDEVMHRDGFGSDPPRRARVLQIERLYSASPDDGEIVKELSWAELAVHSLVILDNGKWAYGDQIDPIDTEYETLKINLKYKTNDSRLFTIVAVTTLIKNQKHYLGNCDDGNLLKYRYFTETGGCIAYFRGDEPILDAARSIATDEIEKTNKEPL